MKKQLHLFVMAITVLLIASCSQNRYIVQPPFTDVSKISSLKKGSVRVKDAQGKELTFDVLGGTVEVLNNQVMVLAE